MKLKFTVQKPANFFHILDSVSLWSIHTRKNIRNYYEKRFGISKKDRELIRKYKKIRKRYGWKKLDSDFYPFRSLKEVKKNLRKRLDKKEYAQLEEIMDNFSKKMDIIFFEWKPYLIKRKKDLEIEIKKHKIKEMFEEIADFYESKNYPKEIYVHLVVNPSKVLSGGGANISPMKHITFEPSDLKRKTKQLILNNISVISHEILHVIENYMPKKRRKSFENIGKKFKLDFEILRESIADTILPDGFLAKKYGLIKDVAILKYRNIKTISKRKNKSKHYTTFRNKLAAHLYQLTIKQFEKKRNIFEGDYLDKCARKYVELGKESK